MSFGRFLAHFICSESTPGRQYTLESLTFMFLSFSLSVVAVQEGHSLQYPTYQPPSHSCLFVHIIPSGDFRVQHGTRCARSRARIQESLPRTTTNYHKARLGSLIYREHSEIMEPSLTNMASAKKTLGNTFPYSPSQLRPFRSFCCHVVPPESSDHILEHSSASCDNRIRLPGTAPDMAGDILQGISSIVLAMEPGFPVSASSRCHSTIA